MRSSSRIDPGTKSLSLFLPPFASYAPQKKHSLVVSERYRSSLSFARPETVGLLFFFAELVYTNGTGKETGVQSRLGGRKGKRGLAQVDAASSARKNRAGLVL